MMKIVNAIQAGDTVILENIGETLDASLDSVLTKVLMISELLKEKNRSHVCINISYFIFHMEGSVP